MFRGTCDAPGEDGAVGGCAHVTGAPPPQAIGEVPTATGPVAGASASGDVARVKAGDPVCRHDPIEIATDGAAGITFTDGTAFNLSNNACMTLGEFVRDPNRTSKSARLNLNQGAFTFTAGKVTKSGGLRIDTPVARIRGTSRDRGIGALTLALTFSVMDKIQAASWPDAFLDDDAVAYKDLPHGTYEIVMRKDGRVIMHDDPGETIVVDPTGEVTRIPNSSSRMADLQGAQQAALATLSQGMGQQGAAPGGSSTPTFNIPLQLQPINFSQPQNHDPAPLSITINATPITPGVVDVPVSKPPPVVPPVEPPKPQLEAPKPELPAPKPVLTADVSGPHAITEILNATGSTKFDTAPSGALTYTDFNPSTVSASVSSITWSGDAPPPSGLAAALAGALSTTMDDAGTDAGAIILTFSAADNNFDFLAAGQTLAITYNVTVTDNKGVSLIQPVTITVTGTNDAPVLAADVSGPHTITEAPNTTGSDSPDTSFGTLTFTDVDLADTHQASASAPTFAWSGGTLTAAQEAALAAASTLTLSEIDSTGSGGLDRLQLQCSRQDLRFPRRRPDPHRHL